MKTSLLMHLLSAFDLEIWHGPLHALCFPAGAVNGDPIFTAQPHGPAPPSPVLSAPSWFSQPPLPFSNPSTGGLQQPGTYVSTKKLL